MLLRFSHDLGTEEVFAQGAELAQIMGRDRDDFGRRIHARAKDELQHIVTFDDPVLVTDNYRIGSLPPTLRDTVFALFASPYKVIEYDGTSLEFDVREYPGVWSPSIDTLLFCYALRKNYLGERKKAIEIGCGSSFIAKYVLDHYTRSLEHMDLVDLNNHAVRCAQYNIAGSRASFHCGDGLQFVQGRKYDMILCNPPYIPRPKSIDDNPYEGIGLLLTLIQQARELLTPRGRLITNFSSLCAPKASQACAAAGVQVRELATKEVPLKVFNVLNNPDWMSYLVHEKGLRKTEKDGYDYWHTISIVELKPERVKGKAEEKDTEEGKEEKIVRVA